jgi:AbrB family looped-hinge helix DNA binding protein
MVIMETTVTVDKAGRVVLPKEVRGELQFAPGDTLDLVSGGGVVTLRPSRGRGRMRKDRGVWVFSGGAPILAAETDRVLDAIRRGGQG